MLTVYAVEKSEIYGHGKRAVIWFSGCTLRCRGCINRHLWERSSGSEMTARALLQRIAEYADITGVTLIGGEPLQQNAEELYDLTRAVVDLGLDVVLFTGYEQSELTGTRALIAELASVVIFGRYVEAQRDTGLLLRGSRNQSLTVRNRELMPYYAEEQRQVEITITDTETVFLGFPEDFIDVNTACIPK